MCFILIASNKTKIIVSMKSFSKGFNKFYKIILNEVKNDTRAIKTIC